MSNLILNKYWVLTNFVFCLDHLFIWGIKCQFREVGWHDPQTSWNIFFSFHIIVGLFFRFFNLCVCLTASLITTFLVWLLFNYFCALITYQILYGNGSHDKDLGSNKNVGKNTYWMEECGLGRPIFF